jgi:hypothetical protein
MVETLAIAAGVAVIIGIVWFSKVSAVSRARTASNRGPTAAWWASFWTAVVVGAFIANHY